MEQKYSNDNTLIALFLTTLLLTWPTMGHAEVSVGIDSMFANFAASSIALTRLVQYSSYIIGIFLVIGSIFKFSQLGSNPQMSPKVPFTMFFVGIGVFSLTSAISVVSQTLAMGPGPGEILMPSDKGLGMATAAGLQGVLLFMRLVGYIAFIRGWLLLNQAGQGKEGTMGRGLTHLGGGVALININIAAKIIANTVAPGMASMIP